MKPLKWFRLPVPLNPNLKVGVNEKLSFHKLSFHTASTAVMVLTS